MAGACPSSPEAAAPAQSHAGACGDGATPNGMLQPQLSPKQQVEVQRAGPQPAPSHDRVHSFALKTAWRPEARVPPPQRAAAVHGASEQQHCNRAPVLEDHRSAGSSEMRSSAHPEPLHLPTRAAGLSNAAQSSAGWIQAIHGSCRRSPQARRQALTPGETMPWRSLRQSTTRPYEPKHAMIN